jgi:hypothetical protein
MVAGHWQACYDIKYWPRDTRVLKQTSLAERQALLSAGDEAAAAAAAPSGGGLPPRPASFGLQTPNGRSATNGPVDGS